MRQRVDKVEEVTWLLLKPVMETKTRNKTEKNKCIKVKEWGMGKGEEGISHS